VLFESYSPVMSKKSNKTWANFSLFLGIEKVKVSSI